MVIYKSVGTRSKQKLKDYGTANFHNHYRRINELKNELTRKLPVTFWFFWSSNLLADGTLVEGKLLTLEDVAITATALAGTRRDDGVDTAGLELLGHDGGDLDGGSGTGSLLLLNRVALLLGLLLGLGRTTAKAQTVVSLIPLTERSTVDLDNRRLGQGVGPDKLVVGRVVDDTHDTGLPGDTLGAPGEVTGVQTKSTELAVTTTGPDKTDPLGTDPGVGGLAALLESSASMLE